MGLLVPLVSLLNCLSQFFPDLRTMGFANSVCIDDSYLQGDSYEHCLQYAYHTVHYLTQEGFAIHPSKSALVPKQEIQSGQECQTHT